MPNHVDNVLYVRASTEEQEAFRVWLEAHPNFCDALLPYPERYRVQDADGSSAGFSSGGYEWCCQNWGTKWGAYDVSYADGVLRYRSAWTPPAKDIFILLSKLFPNIEFEAEWFECGVGFCGGLHILSAKTAEDYGEEPHTIHQLWQTNEYRGTRGG